jgi:hypothetical protein
MVLIFDECFDLLEVISKNAQSLCFQQFVNQLLLELYLRAQSQNYCDVVEQLENSENLLSHFSKESLLTLEAVIFY